LAITDLQPRPAVRIQSRDKPVAVVDIGSNSVRLVIYQGAWRSTPALHNEKTICAIGRNMVSTGRLDEAGMELAVETLARFHELCRGHQVQDVGAVATAAARDASNGREFIRAAEKALGYPIQILAGEDEARIAAEGTIAGIPDADGLVADLGGGSLDMVTVEANTAGIAASLPFGPLRLMDYAGGNLNRARDLVGKTLAEFQLAKSLKGRSLYAVGGIWRALAHVDMDEQNYPLSVLHQYTIPAGRAVKLCRVVSGLSRKSLEKMRSVPKRRAEALPYGALVLEEMLRSFSLKQVVISAYGLREGVFQARLAPEESAKDPLIEFARDVNRRESRMEVHAEELSVWTASLFPQESAAQRRIREAICLFSDCAWRRHPDDRAAGAFQQVLRGAYAAASHSERVVMAAAVFFRYAGDRSLPGGDGLASLLKDDGLALARQIGLAARLAFGISGSLRGVLPQTRLQVVKDALVLQLPASRRALAAEPVNKRLATLADSFGKRPQIVFA
jgi:exopolyphosphatase / guanosine-5'-triphosphate,3'-diphosphate pyrophosphatase